MQLSIPDSHLAHLKEAYGKIYKDYLARRAALDGEWMELAPMLEKLGMLNDSSKHKVTQPGLPLNANVEYSETMSWLKKAKFVLTAKGKAMTSVEIMDTIISEYQPKMDRAAANNSLPATLSVAAKNGQIQRRLRGNEYEYYI